MRGAESRSLLEEDREMVLRFFALRRTGVAGFKGPFKVGAAGPEGPSQSKLPEQAQCGMGKQRHWTGPVEHAWALLC